MIANILDRIAAIVACWGLRRIYGASCGTDIREDFPDEPDLICLSCDAKRLIEDMRTL